MSAISHIGSHFSQNAKTLDVYYEKLSKGLPVAAGLEMTRDDIIREYTIMRLMCDLRIDKHDIERRYSIDFDAYFADAIESLHDLEADGLLWNMPNAIGVSDIGRYFIRNIAMCFDAYLTMQATGKPLFSKTV